MKCAAPTGAFTVGSLLLALTLVGVCAASALCAPLTTVIQVDQRPVHTQPVLTGGVQIGASSRSESPVRQATLVEVFTNSTIYLTHTAGATVYVLDGLQQLEDELSQGLPGDQQRALAMAQDRMRRIGAAELQRRAANAAEGIARARQYGVDRAPAVVFDGQAVVYGVTDVDQAMAIFRRSRALPLLPRAASTAASGGQQ